MADETSEVIPVEKAVALERSHQAWRRFGVSLRSLTPSDISRTLLVLAGVALVTWLVVNTWPALLPFAIGGLIAYILLPVVNILDRVLPRFLASLLVVVVVFSFIVTFLALLTPVIFRQVTALFNQLPTESEINQIANEVEDWLAGLPAPVARTLTRAIDQLAADMRENVDQSVSRILGLGIRSVLGLFNTLGFILGFLIVPTWLLTVLKDQRRAGPALQKALPDRLQADFWALLQLVNRPFRAFFTGQIFIGFCVGLAYYLQIRLLQSLELVNPTYPILATIFVGLTALIPELGLWIGLTPALLMAAAGANEMAVAHVAIVFFANFLVGRLVTPRIERRIHSIHPAILILVIVALSELSLAWVLLAAPVAAAATDLFRYIYGRVGDPPAPAGLLPTPSGRPVQVQYPVPPATTQPAANPPIPLAYRRSRPIGPAGGQSINRQR